MSCCTECGICALCSVKSSCRKLLLSRPQLHRVRCYINAQFRTKCAVAQNALLHRMRYLALCSVQSSCRKFLLSRPQQNLGHLPVGKSTRGCKKCKGLQITYEKFTRKGLQSRSATASLKIVKEQQGPMTCRCSLAV